MGWVEVADGTGDGAGADEGRETGTGGGADPCAYRGVYRGVYRVDRLSPAGGGQNNDVFFGRSCRTGAAVVVKIEGAPGRLDAEARALTWLAGRGVPAPRLLHSGRIRTARGLSDDLSRTPGPRPVAEGVRDAGRTTHAGRFALVLERLEGRAPGAPTDWRAMGRTLACLGPIPLPDAGGPAVRGPVGFLAAHETLGRALAAELPPPYGAAVRAALRAGGRPPALTSPVLTHGDPGPGNFLLCGELGHLIDWETTSASPAGLDPARASFLALLGAAGRTEACAAEARACAAAVWAGYGATARTGPVPRAARRWWTTVAGVQFIANRWHRRAETRILPWRDAVTTLTAAVSKDAVE